ncbi:MAG: peptide-methionine (S)-S-oxide reductase MsrA [Chitinophagaceae bacterium]
MPRMTFLLLTLLFACNSGEGQLQKKEHMDALVETKGKPSQSLDTITLGGGCFWCVEAQLQLLQGVERVVSGYTGGHLKNPDYKSVCSGTTGHAEVVQVVYNPAILSTDALLAAFWQAHDPTQLNRQGNDVGTQYRSAIFYHNEAQKNLALKYIKELNEAGVYDKPIVTQVEPMTEFYAAENYHQDYYRQNSNQGYCLFVIQPKLEKFKKVFNKQLK